jgi:hypothetical protein
MIVLVVEEIDELAEDAEQSPVDGAGKMDGQAEDAEQPPVDG